MTGGNAARYQACFCAENYICSWEKRQKLLPPELHFLTPICFVGCGFAPDPTGGAYRAPTDPVAVFRGPTSKGGGDTTGGEGEESKGRGREERGESSSFALGRKKEVGAYVSYTRVCGS